MKTIVSEFLIECLKSEVEKKIGRAIMSPTDFNLLSSSIESEVGERLSTHTLMRMWKYLRCNTGPSMTTLSIVSRFLGYPDFQRFKLELEMKSTDSSSFVNTDLLKSDLLTPGDTVILTWNPDRRITVEYLGDFNYRVISNENSKLHVGYEFKCVSFAVGLSLTAFDVSTPDGVRCQYVGGKNGGITSISFVPRRSKK